MIHITRKKSPKTARRISSCFIIAAFLTSMTAPPGYAQVAATSQANLPVPGTMVNVSEPYIPAHMIGVTVHPENPLEFDFIISEGESHLKGEAFVKESSKLIKYFLTGLTVPEGDLWVNLSPHEADRIVPPSLSVTEMGRDILAQDYLLKQLTASLIYPEEDLGKAFWEKVYQKAYELYGTTEIPVNTFNKVWIVPEKAVVYQNGTSAFIIENKLKVMLEEDYLALNKNLNNAQLGMDGLTDKDAATVSDISSDVIREVIIPALTKEVNEGKSFAPLRQVFDSLVLANWYKKNLKESLLGQVYVDQNKVSGVDIDDKEMKDRIYARYMDAIKKGVFNYVKDDYDPRTEETIPRKYFSGGIEGHFAPQTFQTLTHIDQTARGTLLAQLTDDIEEHVVTAKLAEVDRQPQTAQPQVSRLGVEDLRMILGYAGISNFSRMWSQATPEQRVQLHQMIADALIGWGFLNDADRPAFMRAALRITPQNITGPGLEIFNAAIQQAQGTAGSLGLTAPLTGLLGQSLSPVTVTNPYGQEQTVPPGINLIGVSAEVYALLQNINFPLAHPSEAGITFFVPVDENGAITSQVEANALADLILHETNTYYTGGLHVESIAVEISAAVARGEIAAQEQETLERVFQDRVRNDIRAQRELAVLFTAKERNLAGVMAKRAETMEKFGREGRPAGLLSNPQNQALRDIANGQTTTTDRFHITATTERYITEPDLLPQDEPRLERVLTSHQETFNGREPTVVARGNGRINIIGNHTDHDKDIAPNNVAMPMAIGLNTLVAASRNIDGKLRFNALNFGTVYEITVGELVAMGQRFEQEAAANNGISPSAQAFKASLTPTEDEKAQGKADYSYVPMALGFIWKAIKAGLPVNGADFTIEGNNPIGGGTSASAGTMVAMALAAHEVFEWQKHGFDINDRSRWANVARDGEVNVFAGRVVGLLDQLASIFGKQGKAAFANFSDLSNVQPADADFGQYDVISVNSRLTHDLGAGESSYLRLHAEYVNEVPPLLARLAEAANITPTVPEGQTYAHASDYTNEQFAAIEAFVETAEGQQMLAEDHDLQMFRRARHVIRERERGYRVRDLFAQIVDLRKQGETDTNEEIASRVEEVADLINQSGEDFSLEGDIAMAGVHHVPKSGDELWPAMDMLRNILFDAGARAVAGRGGGDGGAYFVMVPKGQKAALIAATKKAYLEQTGLELRDQDFVDATPVDGSRVVYRTKISAVGKASTATMVSKINDGSLGSGRFEIMTAIRQGKTLLKVAEKNTQASITVMLTRGGRVVSQTLTNGEEVLNHTDDLDETGGIPIMAPWVNRWVQDVSLQGMRRDGNGIPLHGTVNHNEITLQSIHEDAEGWLNVVLVYNSEEHPDMLENGFPHLRLTWTLRFKGNDLDISTAEENLGPEDTRSTIGYHPFFRVSPDAYFEQADVAQRVVSDEKLIPTGQVEDLENTPQLDIRRAGKPVFENPLDNAYTLETDGQDKSVTFVDTTLLRRTTVTAVNPQEDEGFDTVTVWNGGEARFGQPNLSVENQRARTDALNQQPEKARLAGFSKRTSGVRYHHEILDENELTQSTLAFLQQITGKTTDNLTEYTVDEAEEAFGRQPASFQGNPESRRALALALHEIKKAAPGGINLNPAVYELQIKRDENGAPLPVTRQPVPDILKNIDGFTPVIINVAPAVNLPLLISQADKQTGEKAELNIQPALDPMDRES